MTVDDPDTFNQPWQALRQYDRVNRTLSEDICSENNLNPFGIDYGTPTAEKPDFSVPHPPWNRWSAFRDWMMIKITSIEPRGFYRLFLRFSDGSEGERDFSDLVSESGSLAKPLRDPAYFSRAFTEDGTGLAWPNGLDLDAEALHDAMRSARELHASAA